MWVDVLFFFFCMYIFFFKTLLKSKPKVEVRTEQNVVFSQAWWLCICRPVKSLFHGACFAKLFYNHTVVWTDETWQKLCTNVDLCITFPAVLSLVPNPAIHLLPSQHLLWLVYGVKTCQVFLSTFTIHLLAHFSCIKIKQAHRGQCCLFWWILPILLRCQYCSLTVTVHMFSLALECSLLQLDSYSWHMFSLAFRVFTGHCVLNLKTNERMKAKLLRPVHSITPKPQPPL